MNYKKGFTLIELLVVIAIIGILSSVVLASLNSARDKGADAAIKGNLNGMRAQAELVYDGAGNYSGVCTNSNVNAAMNAAKSAAGATADANSTCVVESTNNSAWAAQVRLKSDITKYYCVDSLGNATTGPNFTLAITSTTTASCQI